MRLAVTSTLLPATLAAAGGSFGWPRSASPCSRLRFAPARSGCIAASRIPWGELEGGGFHSPLEKDQVPTVICLPGLSEVFPPRPKTYGS